MMILILFYNLLKMNLMIVTIMLHDACHDFDNDKSNAAFKDISFQIKQLHLQQYPDWENWH